MYLNHYATEAERFTVHDAYNGRRVHPAAEGPTRSPCRCRPDTGAPCPLVKLPKDNDVCPCSFLGGPRHLTENELALAVMNKTITFHDRHDEATARAKICLFAGCSKLGTYRSGFCKKHHNLRYSRRIRWYQAGNTEPPSEVYLSQPVRQGGTGKSLAGLGTTAVQRPTPRNSAHGRGR